MKDIITRLIRESIDTKTKLLAPEQVAVIEQIAHALVTAYRSCKKMVIFGNGGSAADAQHFAAELVCRYEVDRMALPAIALTTDTSILTATGNDFSYENVFSRQVEAFVQEGDVAIGISTSGNSPNVLKALAAAKKLKAVTIGFTGNRTCALPGAVDICFCAPSAVTGRIQECHSLAIHIVCSLIEGALFAKR